MLSMRSSGVAGARETGVDRSAPRKRGLLDAPSRVRWDRLHPMKISRRRFIQGAAATLLAAPLLRNPEPSAEPSTHWEPVPDPRMRWDSPGANPLEDIRAAVRQMEEATGIKPNHLVLGQKAADDIQGIILGDTDLGYDFLRLPMNFGCDLTIPDGATITGARLRVFEV